MEKELLDREEVFEEIIKPVSEPETEEILPEVEEPREVEVTAEEIADEPIEEPAEEPSKEPVEIEEAVVEEELTIVETPEPTVVTEAPAEKVERVDREEILDAPKKDFKKIWNRISLLLLLAAFTVPVAILAYILIVFFML